GLGVFLLGSTIALLNVRRTWAHWVQGMFVLVAGVASMFGILDYVLEPAGIRTYIAPMTAIVLFLLSLAVTCAEIEWGLGALLLRATPGGELSRRLLPMALVTPFLVGWIPWEGRRVGLYSDWADIAIATTTATLLLSALTIWTAVVVDRAETAKAQAQAS